MSVQASSWAWNVTTGDPEAKFVLICLADVADMYGRGAFLSAITMARKMERSESTVRRALKYLEDKGFIRRGNQGIAAAYILRQDRRPVVFDLAMKINIPEDDQDPKRGVTVTPRPGPNDVAGCSAETVSGCQMDAHGVSNTPPTGCQGDRQSEETRRKSEDARAPARRARSVPEREDPARASRASPSGSSSPDKADEAVEKTKAKIRRYLNDLAKTAYGTDAKTIAKMADCSVDLVREVQEETREWYQSSFLEPRQMAPGDEQRVRDKFAHEMAKRFGVA